MAGANAPSAADPRLGLCARCLHARKIRSSKASDFLLCERSTTDARYPKYPRLPVRACPGFTLGAEGRGEGEGEGGKVKEGK